MRFRKAKHKRLRIRATLDLTPLVDVVFLLVLFFMLSSTFVTSTGLAIEMPETQGAESFMGQQLAISLSPESGGPGGFGRIVLSTSAGEVEVLDWPSLAAALAQYHEAQPEAAVTIRSDQRVSSGRLVEVIGLVTSAGIRNVNIAAEQPQERP